MKLDNSHLLSVGVIHPCWVNIRASRCTTVHSPCKHTSCVYILVAQVHNCEMVCAEARHTSLVQLHCPGGAFPHIKGSRTWGLPLPRATDC